VTLLDAVVASPDAGLGLTEVSYEGQRLLVPNIPDADPGDTVRLSIRAGDVVIATSEPAGISVRSVLSGRIAGIDPIADSAFALVTVDIGDTLLAARLTQHAIDAMDLTVGRAVFALIKAAAFDRNL
jgi:molybdate transport system ATP-binding protein